MKPKPIANRRARFRFEPLEDRYCLASQPLTDFPLTYHEPALPADNAFEQTRLSIAHLLTIPNWDWNEAELALYGDPTHPLTGSVVTGLVGPAYSPGSIYYPNIELSSFSKEGRWWFDVPDDRPAYPEDLVIQVDALGNDLAAGSAQALANLLIDENMRDLPGVKAQQSIVYGVAIDQPTPGDWNRDGTEDLGVFRMGHWYLDTNGTYGWQGTDTSAHFGVWYDKPVVGNFGYHTKSSIGVFRNGQWFLDRDANFIWDPVADITIESFGCEGDIPFMGDWNGDGIDDIGVKRGNHFYLETNGIKGWQANDTTIVVNNWGERGDYCFFGDWDLDGKDQLAVYHKATGEWIFDRDQDWIIERSDLIIDHFVGNDKPFIHHTKSPTTFSLARRVTAAIFVPESARELIIGNPPRTVCIDPYIPKTGPYSEGLINREVFRGVHRCEDRALVDREVVRGVDRSVERDLVDREVERELVDREVNREVLRNEVVDTALEVGLGW